MAQIQLYIASSMDGYIAKENGDIDWLENWPNPNKLDYGYGDFIAQVDTVVMGRKTYETVLGFGIDWPYAHCTSYILTSQPEYVPTTHNTHVINVLSQTSILQMQAVSKKNIWLIGGGSLIQGFLELEAIDELFICIIPILLGKGIPLFPEHDGIQTFDLVAATSFDTHAVMLHYRKG